MRWRDCSLQRLFPFDDILFRSGDIHDQVANVVLNLAQFDGNVCDISKMYRVDTVRGARTDGRTDKKPNTSGHTTCRCSEGIKIHSKYIRFRRLALQRQMDWQSLGLLQPCLWFPSAFLYTANSNRCNIVIILIIILIIIVILSAVWS